MDNRLKVLIIDDDEEDFIITRDLLLEYEKTRYTVDWLEEEGRLLKEIEENNYDVYLLDYRLGKRDGLELLGELMMKGCNAPIILLTGQGDHDVDMKAMKMGAADYLVKGQMNAASLERSIRYAVERKKMEDELQKLSRAVEQSPATIMITDTKGNIEYVNPKFTRLTGYAFQEVVGKNPRFLKSGEIEKRQYQQLWDTILAGKEWRGEFHNKKKNGELFWEFASISPIKDSRGKIAHFLAVKEDISDRKKMENELRETNQDLMSKEKSLRQMLGALQKTHEELRETQNQLLQSEKLASLGHLAAGVAHEINNPLGFISSNIQSLQQYIETFLKILALVETMKVSVKNRDIRQATATAQELDQFGQTANLDFIVEDVQQLLKETINGIERIKKIVLDLRTFSREERDQIELTNIEEIIEGVLNVVKNEIKYKAEVKRNYGSLPLVRCFPQSLGQVFLNLLINATHAIEQKGIIEIKTYEKQNHVCVEITDDGRGIPKDQINKIFDPFFTTKPVGQGTGLGLSISYDIIKKHNGKIEVRSEVDNGTTFTVSLPIHKLDKIGTDIKG